MSDKKKIVIKEGADGLLRGIVPETGAVEWTQKKQHRAFKKKVRLEDKVVKELKPLAKEHSGGLAPYPWNSSVEELICAMYRDGTPLRKIAENLGMPSSTTILVHRERNPEFSAQLRQAARSTAFRYWDDYIDLMDKIKKGTVREDAVAAERLLRDMLKDALRFMDRDTYGDQTKVTAEVAHTFILETGIRRQGDEGFIEIAGKSVAPSTKPKQKKAVKE
jgi:hypothetical protein